MPHTHSQDYHGLFKQPKAKNKGCSIYKHLFKLSHHYSPPSSVEPQAPYYSSERPPEHVPWYEPTYLPVAPSSSSQGCKVACPIESHLMSAQEEQCMVQDTDTGNLVMVPIIRASFSQLGITRPLQNEYAPMGPPAPDHYWQDAMPDHHSYHPWEEPWAHEDCYPPTSSSTALG